MWTGTAGGWVLPGPGIASWASARISPVLLSMRRAIPPWAPAATTAWARACSASYCKGSSMLSTTSWPATGALYSCRPPGSCWPCGSICSIELARLSGKDGVVLVLEGAEPVAVGAHRAEKRLSQLAGRIEQLRLLEAVYTGQVQRRDLLGGGVGHGAGQVDEARALGQVAFEGGLTDAEHGRQRRRLGVGIGDLMGIGVDGRLGHGHGELVAVAIEYGSSLAGQGDRLLPFRPAGREVAGGVDSLNEDQLGADRHECGGDDQQHEEDPDPPSGSEASAGRPVNRAGNAGGSGTSEGPVPERPEEPVPERPEEPVPERPEEPVPERPEEPVPERPEEPVPERPEEPFPGPSGLAGSGRSRLAPPGPGPPRPGSG